MIWGSCLLEWQSVITVFRIVKFLGHSRNEYSHTANPSNKNTEERALLKCDFTWGS